MNKKFLYFCKATIHYIIGHEKKNYTPPNLPSIFG